MKSAGKARSNGLYRHIRTSKEIIRNLLNDCLILFISIFTLTFLYLHLYLYIYNLYLYLHLYFFHLYFLNNNQILLFVLFFSIGAPILQITLALLALA